MLLQQLVGYKPTDADEIPSRPYSRQRTVRWELDISDDGTAELVDLADPTERATRNGRPFQVPNVARAFGIAPCLGADDIQYVLGWVDDKSKPDRVASAHSAFVELAKRWATAAPDENDPRQLVDFYAAGGAAKVAKPAKWTSKDLVIIKVAGRHTTRQDSLWRLWEKVVTERKSGGGSEGVRTGVCLVHGGVAPLLDRIPQMLPKALVPRAENDVAIASANRKIHTYDFREGLGNSPICVDCGQAAVANLSAILSSDRSTFTYERQRSRLAWWITQGASSETIELLYDNPTVISDYLQAVARGKKARKLDVDEHTFCSMTVSGNVSRLVVHEWLEMPLASAELHIAQWFDDMKIIPRWQDTAVAFGPWHLVLCAGQWLPGLQQGKGRYIPLFDKAADRPDDLAALLLHCAFRGGTLPPLVLAHIVRRIRTDLRLDAQRAALLRLALNRYPYRHGKGATALLDEDQNNPAYLCGRLFAVLESLQYRAFPKEARPNTTFFDRYFSGAVANPRIALNHGIAMSPAWLKKLRNSPTASREQAERNARAAVRYTARLRDLHTKLAQPARPLGTSEDQSWFILGYFHQQADDARRARAGQAPEIPAETFADDASDPTVEGNDSSEA